jgi:hypothetical protein
MAIFSARSSADLAPILDTLEDGDELTIPPYLKPAVDHKLKAWKFLHVTVHVKPESEW